MKIAEKIRNIPKNIRVLLLGWFVWSPIQSMSGPYIQLYVSSLGADPSGLSIVSSMSTIANSLSRLIGGYIADKMGRKKILWIGTLIISITYVLMALAPDWRIYAIASTIQGLSLFYQPALEGIQADSVPLAIRGRIYALLRIIPGIMSSFSPLGGAIIVNSLGLVTGVRVIYLLAFAAGLFVTFTRYYWIEETLHIKKVDQSFLKMYWEAVQVLKKTALGLVFVDVLLNLVGAIGFLGNYYMYYVLGVDETGLALLATISSMVNLMMTIPAGYIVDKLGRGVSIITGFLLGTIGLLIFVVTPPKSISTLPLLVASAVIGSVGGPLYGIAYSSLRADLVPQEHRGRVYALWGIPPTFAWSIGAFIGSWIYSSMSPWLSFATSLILRLLLTPLLIIMFVYITKRVDKELKMNK